jgi:hypothetical protein
VDKDSKEVAKWRDQKRRDAPKIGHTRWCTYVDKKVLADFKATAKRENKTLTKAVEEALQNWTYYED